MAFETEGILHKVFDTESKSASFQAREFVIKHDGNYPQFIKFQLTQDRCDLITPFSEGDKLKVSFDLRGREWNEKYFTNLNAWRISKAEVEAAPPQAAAPADGNNQFGGEVVTPDSNGSDVRVEDFDDLPF